MLNVLKVVDVAEQCQNEREEGLLHLFNEQKTSNSAVQYLRLLTSAHLQNNADFFCHFVEAPNFQLYCRQVGPRVHTHTQNTTFFPNTVPKSIICICV